MLKALHEQMTHHAIDVSHSCVMYHAELADTSGYRGVHGGGVRRG